MLDCIAYKKKKQILILFYILLHSFTSFYILLHMIL